jgi:hypothetical protein
VEKAEPAQVGQDAFLGTRPVARCVEIVDAQEPFPGSQACIQPAEQGGSEIASVQIAAGGGSEAPPDALTAELKAGPELPGQVIGQRGNDAGQPCAGQPCAGQP